MSAFAVFVPRFLLWAVLQVISISNPTNEREHKPKETVVFGFHGGIGASQDHRWKFEHNRTFLRHHSGFWRVRVDFFRHRAVRLLDNREERARDVDVPVKSKGVVVESCVCRE